MVDTSELKKDLDDLADEAHGNGCSWDRYCNPIVDRISEALDERDALKAELEVARKQEPVDIFDADGKKIYSGMIHAQQPEISEEELLRLTKIAQQDGLVRVPAQKGNSEREEFNAWNNENSCPLAGRDPKTAAWMAWQARAQLAKVPAQQECTFHGADAQACMDYSKEVPCEFTWEQEAKLAFWHGWMLASGEKCDGHAEFISYIEKRKSELKGGENE